MRLKRNLLVSLGSSVWSAAIGIAVVPLYLKYLGVEAYGLIGLLGTVQAMFSLLDLGLAPAINREVATARTPRDSEAVRELLHTLTYVYWFTGVLIVCVTTLLAPLVARHWIQSSLVSDETITTSVMLMGLVVACRWPIALYLGVIIGAERFVLSSAIAVLMTSASSLGAVVILAVTEPRIESVFAWQAFVGLLYAFAMRHAAWAVLGRVSRRVFSLPALRRVWRFSAGLSGIAMSALLLTQVDKVVLSRALSLLDFAQYSIATIVASGLYLLITPTFNIAYPRFTALKAAGDAQALEHAFRLGTRVFAMFLATVAMLLAVFAGDLVRLWTGNAGLALTIAPVVALLAVGVTLHGVMFFPYALQLAHGKTRLPLTINMVLIVLAVPLMAFLTWQFKLIGGAMASVALFGTYLLLGTWMSHLELPELIDLRWLTRDVLMPLGTALLVGLLGSQALASAEWPPVGKVLLAIALAASSLALALLTAPSQTVSELWLRQVHPQRH